jgi:hypothetical protein
LLREADALEQKGDALRKELDALRGACKVLACKEPSVSEVGSALGELFGYCSDVPVAVRNGSWQSAEKDLDAARRRHSAAVVGIEGLKGQVEDADRWLAAYASLAADVDKLMKQLDWDRKKIGVVDVVRAKAEELLAQAKKLADDVGAGKAMVLRRELDKAAQELASLRKRYEQLVDVRNKFVK